ncbi:retrovirus-related Pol polyprotein from transposon 17.6 [Trichonephila clavipes]|nr:retrovirus-related Pol polyprotein from transposon 17.6 [Trichonephila clavipes]
MYKNALKEDLLRVVEDLLRVVEDLDGTVESTDTIAKLKTKIEKNSTFESDADFVKTLIKNCIDERVSRNEREATLEKQKIELAKLQLAQLEKEVELQTAKNKALSLNPAAKVEEKQSENFNLFFQSLERAFLTKKINDEYKSEILINLLDEKAHNVLLYIKKEELNDYEKLKSIVLREFQVTPRECLNSFKNAVKSSGETYIQFAARLTANFQYYCSLREVNSFESLCDLLISDKLFETLNKKTATHIGIREAEDWFRPIDLAKECDIYISSRSESRKETPIACGYTEDPFKNRPRNYKPKIKDSYLQNLERPNKNCYICGDLSHYARDCEKRFKPKESNGHIHNRKNANSLKVKSEKQKGDEFAQQLQYGIIRERCSDYCSPIVLCKKNNGNLRICIDYRKINSKTDKDRYPLPLIEEVLDQLQSGNFFSTIDLKNGFFHVEMEESSKKFTSFVTHNVQYEFNKVPFGLCNSPSVFQRFINHVFRDLLKEGIVIICMDDIIIPSWDELDGLNRFTRVLKTASEYGLELNFKKCNFIKSKIEFLGHIIEKGTIKPSLDKTKAVQNFPEPKNVKQVQSFLGLSGYFRKFNQNYSIIAKPLSDLLRDNPVFHFGPEQQLAFQTLRQKLSENPVLHIFKQGAKLELHTDASKFGYGAILLQQSDDNKLHPVHYFSKKTTPQEEKYSSYELEVLAVIESLKKFRNYLVGNKFKIVTDCSAFQKTMSKKQLTPKIARWALFLEDFNYEIIHRPGKQMGHVDCV